MIFDGDAERIRIKRDMKVAIKIIQLVNKLGHGPGFVYINRILHAITHRDLQIGLAVCGGNNAITVKQRGQGGCFAAPVNAAAKGMHVKQQGRGNTKLRGNRNITARTRQAVKAAQSTTGIKIHIPAIGLVIGIGDIHRN